MELIIASGNAGKAEEIAQLLHAFPALEVYPADRVGGMPTVEETAPDFRGNALLKARALAARVEDKIILADDSGLSVDALEGRPGVRSARYAGAAASDEDNMDRVLMDLKNVASCDRQASFICVLCLVWPGREDPYFFEGRVHGTLTDLPRGDSGFGYDPIFIPRGYTETFGELGAEVKNAISHRALALKQLKSWMGDVFRG
mgnify:CR=1 FL=1